MRYAFIQQQAAKLPVRTMCRLLAVHPSGYYAWRGTATATATAAAAAARREPPCQREARQLQLLESIRRVHEQSGGRYGSPRVHQALKKQGVVCSRKRVAKLMQQAHIRSTRHRRFRVRTTDSNHEHPLVANLLDRQFEQETINQTWVSDITYVATDEGWLYVASVMDLCSRRIIGWSTAAHLRAELVTEALTKAIEQRCPTTTEDLLHHSDRGVQYACGQYQAMLAQHGITCSMSRRGNCYDNASMESFFKTFKVELVYQEHYATRAEARKSIYSYIEVFYNRQRLHSSLGYRSPVEYEAELGQK
jgi:transposase InsO family protein